MLGHRVHSGRAAREPLPTSKPVTENPAHLLLYEAMDQRSHLGYRANVNNSTEMAVFVRTCAVRIRGSALKGCILLAALHSINSCSAQETGAFPLAEHFEGDLYNSPNQQLEAPLNTPCLPGRSYSGYPGQISRIPSIAFMSVRMDCEEDVLSTYDVSISLQNPNRPADRITLIYRIDYHENGAYHLVSGDYDMILRPRTVEALGITTEYLDASIETDARQIRTFSLSSSSFMSTTRPDCVSYASAAGFVSTVIQVEFPTELWPRLLGLSRDSGWEVTDLNRTLSTGVESCVDGRCTRVLSVGPGMEFPAIIGINDASPEFCARRIPEELGPPPRTLVGLPFGTFFRGEAPSPAGVGQILQAALGRSLEGRSELLNFSRNGPGYEYVALVLGPGVDLGLDAGYGYWYEIGLYFSVTVVPGTDGFVENLTIAALDTKQIAAPYSIDFIPQLMIDSTAALDTVDHATGGLNEDGERITNWSLVLAERVAELLQVVQ